MELAKDIYLIELLEKGLKAPGGFFPLLFFFISTEEIKFHFHLMLWDLVWRITKSQDR